MFGPIEIKGPLELVGPHISILGSNNMVHWPKTLKIRSSSAQFNVYRGTGSLCKRKSVQAYALFLLAVHHVLFFPPALHPYKGVPGYSGSRQGHCNARGSAGYSPSGLETSNAASPLTKTSQDPPPSGTWEGGGNGRSSDCVLGELVEWRSERRAVKWQGEGRAHSPARMDRQVLAHVSHQLWGPMGPNALGGPGLSRPSQPLVPNLGKQKGHEIPHGRKTTTISVVSRNANIHGIMTPPPPGNPAINPLD